LKLLWSYRADGDTSNDAMAGVTVAGRKVFVPVSSTQSILALDADTGRFLWEFRDSRYAADPTTYHEGRLYVWMRRGKNELVALEASDGKPLWRKTFAEGSFGGRKRAAPSIEDGKIYIVEGGPDPAVLALDVKTGETKWRTSIGTEDGTIPLAPSVGGGIVFTALRIGYEPSKILKGATVALDAATGRELWRRKNLYPFKSPPTDGEVVAVAPGYSPAPSDKFHLLDARTGETLWIHPGQIGYPQATILKDMILIHPNGPRFLAVDRKTGGDLWRFSAGVGSACSAPVVSGGYAYFGTGGPFGDTESVLAWSKADSSEPQTWLEKGLGGSVHAVDLSAYYLDRSEVTVAQYRACVEGGGCTPPHYGSRTYRLEYEGRFTNWDQPGREDHPVNAVNWAQADQYCRWAGKRLPTEAEWEKAAGGDGRRYPWGDEEASCDRMVMDDGGDGCGQDSTWPVGAKPAGASPYGVMDLAGNVWEWVADWYDRDYYSRGPLADPLNADPGSEGLKILRGGSLADQNPHIHTVSNRLAYDPKQGYDYTVGFRCARSAP
jgi:formylglycine-generating enzyme required for sulfatase activity/outer membrane protein assembly factor BamB